MPVWVWKHDKRKKEVSRFSIPEIGNVGFGSDVPPFEDGNLGVNDREIA